MMGVGGDDMARILIVDYGSGDFASDIAGKIIMQYPEHHVEVTEPMNAQKLVGREPWDLVVVNANGCRKEAVESTMTLPNALLPPDDPQSQRIAFICDEEPSHNLSPYDSGEYEIHLEDTREYLIAPWQFEKRKYAMRAIDIALRPTYRNKKARNP